MWLRPLRPVRVQPLKRNPEAVTLYGLAIQELQSDRLERRLQAYSNLTEAVKLEPKWVEPLYAKFEAYSDYYIGEKMPPHYNSYSNFCDVRDQLGKRFPDSAQYHVANSVIKWEDWEFEEAIKEAQMAVTRDPTFFPGHLNHSAYVCLAYGDADQALQEMEQAEQNNNRYDGWVHQCRYHAFLLKGRIDLAIQELLSISEWFEGHSTQLHLMLAHAYEDNRQYDQALEEHEKFDSVLLNQNSAKTEESKAWYLKLKSELTNHGPRAVWQVELDFARSQPEPDNYGMAKLSARLGNTNEVFRLLNLAYTNHDGEMQFLLTEPCFASLHGDRQFGELVTKMGFHPVRSFKAPTIR
jgi:tetratricopeptide (TPR) repeat protein